MEFKILGLAFDEMLWHFVITEHKTLYKCKMKITNFVQKNYVNVF